MDRLTKDVNALKTEIQKMDTHTAQLLQLEADVNRLCLEDDVRMKNTKEEDDNPRYVVNTITGRCHMILIRTGLPMFWKTRCTWLYGLAYHEERRTPVEGDKQLCDKCLHHLRAQRKQASAVAN